MAYLEVPVLARVDRLRFIIHLHWLYLNSMENNKPLMNLVTKKYMERERRSKEERVTQSTKDRRKQRKINRSHV